MKNWSLKKFKKLSSESEGVLFLSITTTGLEKYICTKVRTSNIENSYPIQYCRPTFHSDTLKYRQHSKSDIIETSYTEIRSDPFLHTRAGCKITYIRTGWCYCVIVRVARRFKFTFFNNFILMNWILENCFDKLKIVHDVYRNSITHLYPLNCNNSCAVHPNRTRDR